MQDQLTACTGMYVEEALGGHFPLLLGFVQKADHAAAAQGLPEGTAPPGFGPKEAAPIIKDFAARWTSALEALYRCAPAPPLALSDMSCEPGHASRLT